MVKCQEDWDFVFSLYLGGVFMSIFKGSAVAIITPFNNDGSVNFEQFGALIEYQIQHKTDAIVVMGTTGEASTLTHEEHIECIRFCCEKAAGRVPVIAGTGSNCTETAIYLTQEAEKAGADAMLCVTPYYNKATQKGLVAHFTAIANSTRSRLFFTIFRDVPAARWLRRPLPSFIRRFRTS